MVIEEVMNLRMPQIEIEVLGRIQEAVSQYFDCTKLARQKMRALTEKYPL